MFVSVSYYFHAYKLKKENIGEINPSNILKLLPIFRLPPQRCWLFSVWLCAPWGRPLWTGAPGASDSGTLVGSTNERLCWERGVKSRGGRGISSSGGAVSGRGSDSLGRQVLRFSLGPSKVSSPYFFNPSSSNGFSGVPHFCKQSFH